MNKSKVAIKVLVSLLALLSLAAGIPKVMQMPQEVEFLAALGLSGLGVSILGGVQILGGVLLFTSKLRSLGALFAGAAFLASSLALIVGGQVQFGVLSLLPVVLLGFAVGFARR